MNFQNAIDIFESDPVLEKIIKYFGHDTGLLSLILTNYDQKLGNKGEIQLILEEAKMKNYVNSKLKQEQSMTEFIDMTNKIGPVLVELASNRDITVQDNSFNIWLKRIINNEIK